MKLSRSRVWLPLDWLTVWCACRIFGYWRWRTGRKMFVAMDSTADVVRAAVEATAWPAGKMH